QTRQSKALQVVIEAIANTSGLEILRIITFDFQGCGESGGETSYGNYYDEAENLETIIQFAKKDLNLRIIGTLGHSKGAAVVLLHAAKYVDSTPPFVINLSARFDHSETPEGRFTPEMMASLNEKGSFVLTYQQKPYIITAEDIRVRNSLDMTVVKNIKNSTKVLTVHGDADNICPVKGAYEYDRLLGDRHKLVIVKNAGHSWRHTSAEIEELGQTVVEWIKENWQWAIENA
ncbi:4151_t:CDS:2, partial [Paraglomus occultum]